MPWSVRKGSGKKPWKIIKKGGKVVGSSASKAKAKASIRARYAAEGGYSMRNRIKKHLGMK